MRTDPARLSPADPVPPALGAVAALILLADLTRVAVTIIQRVRAFRSLAGLRCAPAAGDLVVVAGDHPDAYALPGRPGRIVVSTGMLRALPADERAVVLAHERAHLVHAHHRYQAVADVACALNPLLRGLRDRLTFSLERWADEEAADAVASRPLAAQTLAHALVRAAAERAGRAGSGPAALAYLRHRVVARVAALHAHRPVSRWSAACPAAFVTAATSLALADATLAMCRFLATLHL
jgi:hypothetical protein